WLRGAVIGALTSFFILTAAAGCVKVDRPRVGEEGSIKYREREAAAQEPLIRCDSFAPVAKPMKLSQYPALRASLTHLSKEEFTPERINRAHVVALRQVVDEIYKLLKQNAATASKARAFVRAVNASVDSVNPHLDEDLETLMRIGRIAEGD